MYSGADEVLIDSQIEITASEVSVSHHGGDPLQTEDIEITIRNETDSRTVSSFESDQFAPGDTISVANTYTGAVTVIVIHEPTGSIIGEQTNIIDNITTGTATPIPTATPTPTPTPIPTPTPTPTPTPEPANFDLQIIGTNSPVGDGDTVQITVEVTNSGGLQDTQTVTASERIWFWQSQVASQDVTVPAGETETITLEWTAQDSFFFRGVVLIESEDDMETTRIRIV